MIEIQLVDHVKILAFWLAFSRWTVTIFHLPIFQNESVPSIIKVLSSFILTYAFFPSVEKYIIRDIDIAGVDNFLVLTAMNVGVGLIIGILLKSIMGVFLSAGTLISQTIGFGAIRYFDPTYNEPIGPIEKMIEWVIVIMIITSGALIPIFKGVFISFEKINLHSLKLFQTSHIFYLEFIKSLFVSALLLAGPLLFINLLLNFVLGITGRIVPQLNVMMMSFAFNVTLGLMAFVLVSNELFLTGFKIYTEFLENWFNLINL